MPLVRDILHQTKLTRPTLVVTRCEVSPIFGNSGSADDRWLQESETEKKSHSN